MSKPSLQYFHRIPNKFAAPLGSYLVEVPTWDDLLSIITYKTPIQIRVTSATCNPKDQFSKKEGRKVASERMTRLYESTDIMHTFVATEWYLQTDLLVLKSIGGTLQLLLKLRGPGKKPFLIFVEE
jgi:hypothetical protein